MNLVFRWTITLLIVVNWSANSHGQSIDQEFDINGDLSNSLFELSVAPFDTENGTRALTSVTLEYDGFVDIDLLITNYTSLDLQEGDWFYDAGANMVLSFDEKSGFAAGGPFYGLGGVFENGITGELSAGSGGPPPPFGNPTAGDVTVSESLSNDFISVVDSDVMLNYFVSDTPLNAKMTPFQDFAVSMPEAEPFGFIDAKATDMEFGGKLKLTYNWVPALGRPEDCNGDGRVDAEDLTCACDAFASIDDILHAADLQPGDMDGDGSVDFADFLTLSANFGFRGNYVQGDLDCDGVISFADFLILSGNFSSPEEEIHSVAEPNLSLSSLFWSLLILCGFRRTKSA